MIRKIAEYPKILELFAQLRKTSAQAIKAGSAAAISSLVLASVVSAAGVIPAGVIGGLGMVVGAGFLKRKLDEDRTVAELETLLEKIETDGLDRKAAAELLSSSNTLHIGDSNRAQLLSIVDEILAQREAAEAS